jgi:hypothetical protein
MMYIIILSISAQDGAGLFGNRYPTVTLSGNPMAGRNLT